MSNFSGIASSYRRNSLVQASAGQALLTLLAPGAKEDILDLGCGTGNLTAALRAATSGRVVGLDRDPEMLREAQTNYGGLDIEFLLSDGERLPFSEEFDGLFCNSVFQWFAHPSESLAAFHRALRPGGRVAMQAPATHNYSPNFLRGIAHCCRDPEIAAIFATFTSPWFFLETAAEYGALFEECEFQVRYCQIEEVRQSYSIDQALGVFKSGAAAGYLDQARFSSKLPDDFAARMLAGMRESFAAEADGDGMVKLLFSRIFVLAGK